ncbi:MAG: M20 family peptidase [Myxococcota bacterium]
MKKALGVLALLGVGLLLVMTLRALMLPSRQVDVDGPADAAPLDAAAMAARLGEAIRFRTISEQDGGDAHAEAFRGFEAFLVRSYPRVHATLARERVDAHSLLYTWKGRGGGAGPLLLAAHHDVVPVEPGTEGDWQEPPFAGRVVDGVVWGRGALDDKGGLIAILEAVESLLAEGFTPPRDVYLAFGHDEEIGGSRGAVNIAATLAGRGVRLDAVVDEGGAVVEGMLDGVDGPIAVVGIAEKGSVSLKLTIRQDGGHSSTPPRHSAVGILATAITRLEANPMPARFEGTTRQFLETLAPELPFPLRLALSNLWITSGLLERVFRGVPPLDAMVRTTTAATIFHGGVKANVLPKQVEAVVNFRILPGDTIEDVVTHVRRTIDDERIEVEPTGATKPRNPSGVSPVDSPAFEALARAIRATYPKAIVVPYLVVGGTDARHYGALTDDIYRFNGFHLGSDALKLAHGTNERLSAENLEGGVRFFRTLLREER